MTSFSVGEGQLVWILPHLKAHLIFTKMLTPFGSDLRVKSRKVRFGSSEVSDMIIIYDNRCPKI